MKRFHGNRTLAMLFFFPLLSVQTLLAASPDQTLLSLVPPGAQIVAGATDLTAPGKPHSFLLTGYKNVLDRSDFLSLAGVDDSMTIHQMIFVTGSTDPRASGEHSLLVRGHFDQARIFKAAVQNGATVTEFKGFRVLVQHPFERELDTFKDVRWMVVIDSNLALFGTTFSIQQELNRHLARSAAEPSLMQRLAHLRRDDATWSILALIDDDDGIEQALGSLDPVLAKLIHDRKPFQFGIRYGRKVEVEYEVTVPSGASAQSISNFSTQSVVAGNRNGSSLSPRLDLTADRAPVHGVVKVTTKQYEAWLDECARSAVSKSGN
jgi:hypothetical protein